MKMTENEKLDLILAKVQGIENEMHGMKAEMQDMKTEMQDMKTEMQDMKTEIQSTKEKVDKLALGQLEIKKEMYMMNRKISDTYNVALDALGTNTQSRIWFEHGTLV